MNLLAGVLLCLALALLVAATVTVGIMSYYGIRLLKAFVKDWEDELKDYENV